MHAPTLAAAAPSAPHAGAYQRHRPEHTTLYRTLQANWRTFAAETEIGGEGRCLPRFVVEEMEAFLRCGILAHGFMRVWCSNCNDSRLVAFSCGLPMGPFHKRRGFCPSCIGRRMCDTAAHLVDHVIPRVPVRQWVLTVPHALRYAMAFDPELTSKILRVFVRAVTWALRRKARRRGIQGHLKTGAVTVIQRFDSAPGLNVHFHSLVLDGVYAQGDDRTPQFHPTPVPTDQEVVGVAGRVFRQVGRLLSERDESAATAEPLLAEMSAASLRKIVAMGPRRGCSVRRLGAMRTAGTQILGKRCAQVEGFNVHANVHLHANDHKGLESPCRYIARPPLSAGRLAELPDGSLSLRLKRPWSDGTTHFLFSPEEFIEKLIPLIPRPRAHITRYHGVLAPAAGWRAQVVPDVFPTAAVAPEPGSRKTQHRRPTPWAALLKRVFFADALTCSRCGGPMKIVAAVMDSAAIESNLRHLQLDTQPPPIAPARPPPDEDGGWNTAA